MQKQFSRVYSDNRPVQGLFKKKTWLEKMGRDNPTMLLLMGVGVGVAGAFAVSKMTGKKKKR
jgi:hypothetical protein